VEALNGYSPIQHLVSIVCPPWIERGKTLLAMLTAAFDAGGDEATPILTVAGFVSGANDWDNFSRQWKARLAVDGITYFRAVEAAHFRKQFQPWHDLPDRDKRRRDLFADLMEILKRNVYRKFGCSIINSNFTTLSQQSRDYYNLRAYSVAGRTCDKQVREWMRDERINAPVELVFEAGDEGRRELQLRLIADSKTVPIFRPKKDTVRKDGTTEYGFVPLQAADWLAYEITNAHEEFEAGRLQKFRWPFEEFNRILGEPTTYTESNLEEMEESLQLNKSLLEWEHRTGIRRSRD